MPSYYQIKGLEQCTGAAYSSSYDFYHKCEKKCPRQCETIKFGVKHFESDRSDNATVFIFSFSDLSSYKITQLPKINEFTLISSIGGSLSLFIGVSFLSSVEVVEFFIDVFYVILTNRSNKFIIYFVVVIYCAYIDNSI